MQQTGGGVSGPIGARARGSLERLLQQRKQQEIVANSLAGPRERGNLEQADNLRDYNKLEAEDEYTPLDFAKQVYKFPGKVYDDADQSVRGLIDLGKGLFGGKVDPGLAAEDMLEGTIENWTHPVDYANEHPLGFMADAAMVGGALGAADNFLFQGRAPIEGPQAIGAVGRRLEEGQVPNYLDLDYEGQLMGSLESSTDPALVATDDLTRYVGKPDPAEKYRYSPIQKSQVENQPQALVEAVTNEANVAGGSMVDMPGSARGSFPYPRENSYLLDAARPGTLIEYLDDLKKLEGPEELNYRNPQVVEQMRGMNILDRIFGNEDRAFGANMHGRDVGGETIPVAVDQGYGLRPRTGREIDSTMYDPHAWQEGRGINPREISYVQSLVDYLRNPQGPAGREYLHEFGSRPLEGAIDRALQILQDEEMPEPMFQNRGY